MSTLDRIIKWNRKTNTSEFYYYTLNTSAGGVRNADIRAISFDRSGRLWCSITGEGIAILESTTGKFRNIKVDTALGVSSKGNLILDILLSRDNLLWFGSSRGAFTIDPVSLAVNTFSNGPLSVLTGKRVNGFLEDDRGRIWIATNNDGLYRFDPSKNVLSHFGLKDGLASDRCYMIAQDKKGDCYISTSMGFSRIDPTDNIRSFTKKDGLRYDRCESVLSDDDGQIWVSNKQCIVRFDPVNQKMQFFDDNAGFRNEGFRVGNCIKTSSGEIVWGGYKGVSFFYPKQLKPVHLPLEVNIYQATTKDTVLYFNGNTKMKFPFQNNSISFQYAAAQLGYSQKLQYQFKLDGYDPEWQKGGPGNQARYISLPPGNYNFRVRASRDGIEWNDAKTVVQLDIIPPFWRRWWFVGLVLAAMIGSLYVLFQSRNRKIRQQREELETQQAINYFASSIAEHHSEEGILWDVAKNCIGKLHFEGCVIYLLNEEGNMLVQKAAYGRKSKKQYEINEPIEIAMGEGIVGSVAKNGKAEIIHDTRLDPRYIVDEERKNAEIAIPMIFDGKVLGVIDCEHSSTGFFTQRHFSVLNTIASLCANKIIRVRADKEKQEAQGRLMDTQKKMAEVEMQALRAQMNPHFIFNCLNSINRYIVKSDQATASRYLTRFSKLIRLILDNSNSKNILLSNELEALGLYIEMEALRFDKKFAYDIHVARNINKDGIEVPPLIIQPYVENAIWHGLLQKEEQGHLQVNISMKNEGMLECVIEDNGIGRERSKELKSKSATSRKSLGMKLTEDRLAILNKHTELNASVEIHDLKSDSGVALGTRVTILIPV
jgi:putative methionine-R-sulfoxide reductase with GAF domain/streptogramin lyase